MGPIKQAQGFKARVEPMKQPDKLLNKPRLRPWGPQLSYWWAYECEPLTLHTLEQGMSMVAQETSSQLLYEQMNGKMKILC